MGSKLYDNATPKNAAEAAIDFIVKHVNYHRKKEESCLPFDVIDPFVGRGTIGIVAIQADLRFLA